MSAAAWGSSWQPGQAADAPGGRLLLPRGRDVALVAPDGTEDRTVLSLQPGEFIADVSLSTDRSRIAFGMFTARASDGPGGSDIVVAPVDAPDQRTVVVPRDRPGMLLAAPHWSPDGTALVFEAVGLSATGQATVTAEWVSADGSGRRTIAQQARYPSFSPDGRRVVYTRALPTGDALWEVSLDSGEARQILPDSVLLLIAYPRYSPDGQSIGLAGVGDAGPMTPIYSPAPGVPPEPGAPAPPAAPAPPSAPTGTTPKLLGPAPALDRRPAEGLDPTSARAVAAHGFPASPYVVPVAGGDPRQLADLPIDDGAVAWSPEGNVLAISGANGVFLVNVADGSTRRTNEKGSFGAIDWR